jgi:hypothetical protein
MTLHWSGWGSRWRRGQEFQKICMTWPEEEIQKAANKRQIEEQAKKQAE